MRFPFLPIAVVVAFVGCDKVNELIPVSGGKSEAAARQETEARRRAADEEARLASSRALAEQQLKATCSSLDVERGCCEQRAAKALRDRDRLSSRIGSLSAATNAVSKLKQRHDALIAILNDAEVNELARRYLERDFALARLDFEARVAEAVDRKRAHRLEVDRERQDYENAVKDAQKRSSRARNASNSAEAGVRREIAALERREKELQRALSMSSASIRAQRRRELDDVSSKLRNLQVQYDSMRVNRNAHENAEKAARQEDAEIVQAQRRFERASRLADRRLAGEKNPAEIMTECEEQTVRTLERAIADVERQAREGEKRLAACLGYVRSMASGVRQLDEEGLRKVLADVDARVAKARPEK